MPPILIVLVNPRLYAAPGIALAFVGMQVHVLKLQAAPELFHRNGVTPATPTAHGDTDIVLLQKCANKARVNKPASRCQYYIFPVLLSGTARAQERQCKSPIPKHSSAARIKSCGCAKP